MSEKLLEPDVPERPQNLNPLRKNMFINGVPLENSNSVNQLIQPSPTNPVLVEKSYQPKPMYSNLGPAPYNTLSSDASSQNLIESIFSQSQTPVRFSPTNAQQITGLAQPAVQQPFNPLEILAKTANSLGGQEMLNQFLGGGGSPLEQITKLARNLLAGANPEMLSTLTKTLATNTVAEGSKLTSNAVIQPASVANALAANAEKVALASGAAETLFSSAKDEENSNGNFV